LTCFTVERIDENARTVDLLMCGNGRWGGLGNHVFSSAQGNPLRAKSVSGLLECEFSKSWYLNGAVKAAHIMADSEKDNSLQPIVPYSISISPTGHVLLTLDTHKRSGSGGGGRDLFVWGANQQYELGNGKRTGQAAPTALEHADGSRVMLMKTRADVKDMQGKSWKNGVNVKQYAQAGYGNTIVYWKIC
jgi:hypothetical protein